MSADYGPETECHESGDGLHCAHWYDGGPCCYCADPAVDPEAAALLGELQAEAVRRGWSLKRDDGSEAPLDVPPRTEAQRRRAKRNVDNPPPPEPSTRRARPGR